jgi:hypothetical protein
VLLFNTIVTACFFHLLLLNCYIKHSGYFGSFLAAYSVTLIQGPVLSGPIVGLKGRAYTSHRGGPSSCPGHSMWNLWWTKWHWHRFISEFIIPPWLSIAMYHMGMNNSPVGGRSSETYSHHIDVNDDRVDHFLPNCN